MLFAQLNYVYGLHVDGFVCVWTCKCWGKGKIISSGNGEREREREMEREREREREREKKEFKREYSWMDKSIKMIAFIATTTKKKKK